MKLQPNRKLPPARLVVLGISLTAGIGAAVIASGLTPAAIPPVIVAKGPVSTIVVAAGPLEYGTTLTDDNVSEAPWESSTVPEGAFQSKADLLKDGARAALTSMKRNEPVLSSRITGPNQPATLAALTEPGMRAVSVRVDEARGVAGFVRMGDRVDVILTRSDSRNDSSGAHADVLLQDIKVLASGQTANDRQERPTVVQTVTVEVSTEQAQKLILAESVGTLSLVLRQAGKANLEAVRRITLADLGESEPAAAPAPSHVAEVWIYRGDSEPTIYRDVYREAGRVPSVGVAGRQHAAREARF
ncbi:MAG: Flp pilus assembly protein CpaB [Methylocella sp.]